MTELIEPPSIEQEVEFRPLPIAQLSPDFCRLTNGLVGRRQKLPFTWNGHATSFQWTPVESVNSSWQLSVKIDGQSFDIGIQNMPDVAWMSPSLAGIDVATLPPELALGVWQVCLAELTGQLSAKGVSTALESAVPAAILPAEDPAQDRHVIGWNLDREGSPKWASGWISGGLDALRQLAERFAKAKLTTDAQDLPIELQVHFEAGRLSITASTLKTIEPQDVLLVDVRNYLSQRKAVAFAGDIQLGSVEIQDEKATLLQPNLKKTQTNLPMTESNQDAATVSVDDLEIELSFVVGRSSIALRELRELAPGVVFDLGGAPNEAVTICANGRPIGKGELVDVGGRTGVRVLNFHS